MENPSKQEVKDAFQEWRKAHENLDKAMSKFYSPELGQSMPVLTEEDTISVKHERETFDKYQNLIQKYNQNRRQPNP